MKSHTELLHEYAHLPSSVLEVTGSFARQVLDVTFDPETAIQTDTIRISVAVSPRAGSTLPAPEVWSETDWRIAAIAGGLYQLMPDEPSLALPFYHAMEEDPDQRSAEFIPGDRPNTIAGVKATFVWRCQTRR